jgi:hypothetical protein
MFRLMFSALGSGPTASSAAAATATSDALLSRTDDLYDEHFDDSDFDPADNGESNVLSHQAAEESGE